MEIINKQYRAPLKPGLHRRGKKVYIILEFSNQYDAIEVMDLWANGHIMLEYTGDLETSEED